MFTTLEKEFKARVLLHKITISQSAIAHKYIEEQKAQDIVLPDNYLKQDAMKHASKVIQDVMFQGSLDEEYNKAWEWAVKSLPDNFSIMKVKQSTL